MESRASALQNKEPSNGRTNFNTLTINRGSFDIPGLSAVPEEGVRVRIATNKQTSPAVHFNFDVSGVDVLIGINEMSRNDGRKELRRRDRVLLCHDVDGLLHSIGGHHDAVVGLSVAIKNASIAG